MKLDEPTPKMEKAGDEDEYTYTCTRLWDFLVRQVPSLWRKQKVERSSQFWYYLDMYYDYPGIACNIAHICLKIAAHL